MEAIKSYRVPVEAPKDLIEDYFKIKKKALNEIFKHISYSKNGKVHLRLGKEDRKSLRDELLKDWKYARHYVDSAINSVIWFIKGWIKLYNRAISMEVL